MSSDAPKIGTVAPKLSMNIIQGDVIEVLRDYPDESFTACFCDPPYGLKFMGKAWDHGVPAIPYWAEILRVLKPGAVLMAFGGTRTWHRLAVAIEDAGFELFDTAMWLHAQGFPKSRAIGRAIDKEAGKERKIIGRYISPAEKPEWVMGRKHGGTYFGVGEAKKQFGGNITAPATDAAKIWEGYGTSLKPAWEPILCARKPRTATYAKTAMEHGTAALNIDGCRIASAKPYTINTWNDGAKPFGDGAGHPFTGRQQSGRWPANLLFSHLPECKRIGVRRVKAAPGGSSKRNSKLSEEYWGQGGGGFKVGRSTVSHADPDGLETVDKWECAEGCPVAMLDEQSGECGNKWKKNYGEEYAKKQQQYGGGTFGGGGYLGKSTYSDAGGASRFFKTFEGERFCYCSKANKRERNMGLPEGERNLHTTVKPLALCKYLATFIVPPEEYRDEAQLLVPFAGVMSEAIGALLAGWRNITAIELEKEYCEIGQKRVDWWVAKMQETGLTDPKAILKKGV